MSLSPLGPKASAFYLDNSEIACIMGPVGSAKTTASAFRLVRHAYAQRAFQTSPEAKQTRFSRFVIVRNTGPQLVDTTMKSWFKLFPTDNKFRRWTSTTKTQTWKFIPKGGKELIHAEFIFRALDDEDDVANLLSLEVTGFWFNELREINSDILAHAGRRAGRYPGADMGGCTWHGWFGDTNPWARTSDLHTWFVGEPREGYKFIKQPGGMDPDAENLENLNQTPDTLLLPWNHPKRREQGRTYYINALRDMRKEEADMYVHCKYGSSRAGKPVFASYNEDVHRKEFELAEVKEKTRRKDVTIVPDPTQADVVQVLTKYSRVYETATPIRIGYDNTGRTPAALIGQKTLNGQYRYRYEFIGEGMGLRQHAAALAAFLQEKIPNYRIERITCDPAGAAKDSGELDMRQLIQRQFPGVPVMNARTNDIETRIDAVETSLKAMVNGEPKIVIHPDCRILCAAAQEKYQYRRLKVSGEERFTEQPDKSAKPYCDIADALQYDQLGGGEGRVAPASAGQETKWPTDGAAIHPKAPDPQKLQRSQGAVFDPRTGSVFNER